MTFSIKEKAKQNTAHGTSCDGSVNERDREEEERHE